MQRHFQLALNPNERFMLFTRLVFETRDTENKKRKKQKKAESNNIDSRLF